MTSPLPEMPWPTEFRLDRPAAMIAALPALLGFTPERSLVVVTLADGLLDAVLRKDMDALDNDTLATVAELVGAGGAGAAIAVVIGEEPGVGVACDIIGGLSAQLACRGVSLLAGHVVDRVAAGGRWHCYDGCGAGGPIDDPRCSPVAVAAVMAGRALHHRREDLLALMEPSDPLSGAELATSMRCARGGPADAAARDRRDIERVMAVACRMGEGRTLARREIVATARALTVLRVRDTLYALAVGEMAADAERLWLELSRRLPPPWRAEALVLLSFSAYVRGDGPLAGIGLDAALAADPGHRLGRLLSTALHAGMRPGEIRTLADTGFRVARELGISLPPKENGWPTDDRRARSRPFLP